MHEEQRPGLTSPDVLTINFDFLVLIAISAAQGILGAACGNAGMLIFGVLETGTLIFLTREDHPDFIGDPAYRRRLMGDTAIGYICSKDRPMQNQYIPAIEAICLILAVVLPTVSVMAGIAKVAVIFGFTAALVASLMRYRTDLYWVAGEYRGIRVWYQRTKKEE